MPGNSCVTTDIQYMPFHVPEECAPHITLTICGDDRGVLGLDRH